MCRSLCLSMTVARRWASVPHAGAVLAVALLRSLKQRAVKRRSAAFSKRPCLFYFAFPGGLFLSGGTLTHSWGSPDSDDKLARCEARRTPRAAVRRLGHADPGSGCLPDAAAVSCCRAALVSLQVEPLLASPLAGLGCRSADDRHIQPYALWRQHLQAPLRRHCKAVHIKAATGIFRQAHDR